MTSAQQATASLLAIGKKYPEIDPPKTSHHGLRGPQAIQSRSRRDAEKAFMVVAVKKDGSLRTPDSSDWDMNAHKGEDGALARQAELRQLNPGMDFAVVRLRR